MTVQFTITTYEELKAATESLCDALKREGIPAERVFDCKLVAYELVGNVLQHSACSATLCVTCSTEQVCLTVCGEKGYIPPVTCVCPPCEAERGRGLYLVDSMSVERTATENGGICVRICIKG